MSVIPSAPLRERLSAAARGQLFSTGSTLAASFVSQVLLARRAGPEGVGEYTATTLFVVVLTALASLGAPYALAQRVAVLDEAADPRLRDTIRAASTIAVVGAVISAAVGVAAWPPFAVANGLRGGTTVEVVAAACAGAMLLHIVGGVLLGRLRMIEATILYLLQPATVVVGLLVSNAGTSTLAALGFVVPGATAMIAALVAGARPGLPMAELRELLRRSVPAATVPYAAVITTWLDRLVVGVVAGPTALGWWATATYLTEGILRLPRAFGAFGVPMYARLTADEVGVRRVLESHVRLLLAFAVVAGSMLIAGAPGIIRAIYTADFVLATTALRLLALALAPAVITLAFMSGAVGTDRASRLLLAIAPLQLVLGVALTSVFSIAGTALAQLATWTIAVVVLARRGDALGEILTAAWLARALLLVIALGTAGMALATAVPWPVASALVGVAALASSSAVLVREPERRLVRHLLRWGAP